MKKFFLISTTIHATMLFLLVGFSLQIKNRNYNIPTITVYLSSLQQNPHHCEKRFVSPPLQPEAYKAGDNLNKKHPNNTQKQNAQQKQIASQNKKYFARNDNHNNGQEKISDTITTLHNLIQNKIKHPTIPIYKNRRVHICFMLLPSGEIKSEKILQSSGIAILDQTALNGLKSISKTKAAKNLLKKPKEFTVPIEFL